MVLRELSTHEFTEFQQNHPLSNYHQTVNYALLMSECGYDYDLIGYLDDYGNIKAASLILFKPIGIQCFYGYAPRGFLIDYKDKNLLIEFSKALKKYYYEKNVIFIKSNPNIKIGEVNNTTFIRTYNDNTDISFFLEHTGYRKLKDNLYFETQLPRYEAFINLKECDEEKFSKNTKNKIKKGLRKGLTFEKCTKENIHIFYDLIKRKKNNPVYFYQDYYTAFEKNDNVDLFLVSVDYNTFLIKSHDLYNEELERNNILNERLAIKGNNKSINVKMYSDKNLLSYKNDIMEATKGLSENKKVYLAGALVIKHNNTATIVMSGYDKNATRFAANYFLHYSLINYYKDKNFDYLDLNGVVGDFTAKNPYTGLNRFKLGFKPHIYEYIGEFDLIIESESYNILLEYNIISKEFNRTDLKKTEKELNEIKQNKSRFFKKKERTYYSK